METKIELIKINEYYHFDKSLDYLKESKSSILEVIDENLYERVFVIDNNKILVSLSCEKLNHNTTFKVVIKGDKISKHVISVIIQRLYHIFSLDKGNVFDQLVQKDEKFYDYINYFQYIRPVLIGEPYEALIWSIIGQQINIKFAEKLRYRFLNLCEATTFFNDKQYYYFPSPEQVLSKPPEEFKNYQFSQQKINYIFSLSNAIATGELNLNVLGDMNELEARKYLTSFKGIGKWTADSILMRSTGLPNIFPSGDVGLQRIVSKAYNIENLSEKQLESLSQKWSPHRSWAAFLWWYKLQSE